MRKRSPLAILLLTVFIDLLGFGLIIPLLPLYARQLQASPFEIGLLMASYSLMQFIFAPIWGQISDRVGRRPIILLSLLGSVLAYTLFGLASSLPLLFLARLLAGLFGGNISAAQAYIADITPPEERARGMGLIGMAFGLGFIFGPALGGWLGSFSYHLPPLVTAGLALINVAFAYFMLPESLNREARSARTASWRESSPLTRIARAFEQPQLRSFLWLFALIVFAFSVMEATLVLFLQDIFGWGVSRSGYLFAYLGVVIALMQGGLIGRLVKAFGERRLVSAGALMMAASLLLVPFAATIWELGLVLTLLALGDGMVTPSLSSLISRQVSAEAQGSTLGVSQSLSSVARVFGPLWGGLAYNIWGPAWPFLSGGVVMALGFLMSLKLLQKSAQGRLSQSQEPSAGSPGH
ncbi:MAG TPA: MFS transporter [Candidatus Fraserbacteria bacterium]|nr:MFS transporter [Candidatus Fraserbacteria bacterium]